jgi:hypothetical protein
MLSTVAGDQGVTVTPRRRVDGRALLLGLVVSLVVLSPASMLGGAWLLGIVDPLAVVVFALPPVIGVVLLVPRRTRWVGVGVLLGCVLWWAVVVPLLAALLGG